MTMKLWGAVCKVIHVYFTIYHVQIINAIIFSEFMYVIKDVLHAGLMYSTSLITNEYNFKSII